jgi:hypothetical protein
VICMEFEQDSRENWSHNNSMFRICEKEPRSGAAWLFKGERL